MVHYDPKKELILTYDASQYISTAWEQFYPISCQMVVRNQQPKKNYSQLDKEGLDIIFGVKKFHQYLLERTFRIITDHKPLISLLSLPPRIIRWSLLMSSYDYSIMYKPETNIVAANAISCLLLQENLQVPTLGCIIHLMDKLDSANICRCNSKDPGLPSCMIKNKSTRGTSLLSVSYKEILTECQKWMPALEISNNNTKYNKS